jgi:hypothetical protein
MNTIYIYEAKGKIQRIHLVGRKGLWRRKRGWDGIREGEKGTFLLSVRLYVIVNSRMCTYLFL